MRVDVVVRCGCNVKSGMQVDDSLQKGQATGAVTGWVGKIRRVVSFGGATQQRMQMGYARVGGLV